MRISKRTVYIIAAVAVAGAVWAWLYYNAPRRVIERRLNGMAETVSFTAQDEMLAKALKVKGLINYVAPKMTLKTPVRELNGDLSRPVVLEIYKAVLSYSTEAQLTFSNIVVTDVSGTNATFTVDIKGHIVVSGETRNEAFRAGGTAVKIEGSWLFTGIKELE